LPVYPRGKKEGIKKLKGLEGQRTEKFRDKRRKGIEKERKLEWEERESEGNI